MEVDVRICVGIRDSSLRTIVVKMVKDACPNFCFTEEKDADIVILNYPELDSKTLQFDRERFYGILNIGGWKTSYPSHNPSKVEFFDFDVSLWVRFSEFLEKMKRGCKDLIFEKQEEAAF